ncbi:MAG TPA: hypothetical protein VNL71_24825, partial [Chloroflexota bacterium]|nr:hypothetical protein [Chloroflexota bacterium]
SGKVADLTTAINNAEAAIVTIKTQTGQLAFVFGVTTGTIVTAAGKAHLSLKKGFNARDVQILAGQLVGTGKISQATAQKIDGMAGTIAASMKKGTHHATEALKAFNGDTTTAMTLNAAIMSKGGAQSFAEFVNAQHGGLPAVVGLAARVGVTIPTKYMSLLRHAMGQGGKISMQKLSTEIMNGSPGYQRALQESIAQGSDAPLAAYEKKFKAGGKNAMLDLAQSILAHDKNVTGNTKTVLNNAVAAMQNPKHAQAARAVGAALSNGIAAGLLSANGAVSAAAASVVANAIAAAQKSGKIKSPSRATAELVGLPLGQGVAVGINQSTMLAAGAMASLVNGTIAAGRSPASMGGALIGGALSAAGGGGGITLQTEITINAPTGNANDIS